MKKTVLIIFALAAISQIAVSQSYNNPESIVYDAVGKRYFISNKGGNSIVQLDSLNQLTNFVTTGLKNPKGLLIVGDTLISVNNTSVQGFLLSDASRVFNVTITGSSWMNDVATDGKGNLYVSDSETNKIHIVSLKSGEYSTLTTISSGPNGLLYDAQTNSLLTCNSGNNAKIFSYNFSSLTLKTLIITRFSDLDGLARDNCGNYYVSSWGTNSVYAFDPLFQNPPTVVSKGHNGPADISIRENEQILTVPNFDANTISLINLNMGCAMINYLLPQKNSIGLNDSLFIDWDDVAGVSNYELQYCKDSTFSSSVIPVQSNQSNATIKGLSLGTKYYWRVRPIDGDKKSIFNEVWNFSTKIKTSSKQIQLKHVECKVYPNPTTGKVFIEIDDMQTKLNCYSIFDFSGKIVKQGQLDTPTLDVSELKKGLYLLSIQLDKETISKKITIEY
jgi:hypothetical protein